MPDTTTATAPIEIEVQVPRYLQNIRERKSCFQRSPLRERCLTSFFGLLGGFALGIVVAFALDANTQDAFMPLIIHRAIYISLLPGLLGFFGLTCGFGVVEVCCCGCRTGFPERCGGKACSICCGLLWALPFALTSILVMAVPGHTSSNFHAATLLLFDEYAASWAIPPVGYCDESSTVRQQQRTDYDAGRPPWWQAYGSNPDSAASAIVDEMTDAERHQLTNGVGFIFTGPAPGYFYGQTRGVPRLGLPSIQTHDASQGYRTHVKEIVGLVTSWPVMLALGATWDRSLARQMGMAVGYEFRVKGAHVMLGPGLEVHRVARNGRNAEYLPGEDPFIGAALGGPFVAGVQSQRVAICVKHLLLNTQETNRLSTSTDASDRTWVEAYAPPFKAAIDAGAVSVMCGYNLVNNSYACGSSRLLNGLLRRQMNFSGFVMSDWWATRSQTAASGGVDMVMPGNDNMFAPWLRTNYRPEGAPYGPILKTMATRIVRGMISSSAWDEPRCSAGCDCDEQMLVVNATSEAHLNLSLTVAESSIILLKNELRAGTSQTKVLPLRSDDVIAVVGTACSVDPPTRDFAEAYWQDGNYFTIGGSGRVVSDRTTNIVMGLQAKGFNDLRISTTDVLADAQAVITDDVTVVITCGAGITQEGADRPHLRLDQHDFITELSNDLASSNTPLVVVSFGTPGQIVTSPWADSVDAFAASFYLGEKCGEAWANILTGEVNPSAKLPITFPAGEEDMPLPCDNGLMLQFGTTPCEYTEGLNNGWKGLINHPVAYPFGYGLSYTTFTYSWASHPYRGQPVVSGDTITMAVSVENTGSVAGVENVQLYLQFPEGSGEPPQLLRGFDKTPLLAPGSSSTIIFALNAKEHLSVWEGLVDDDSGRMRLVTGSFGVVIGASSRELRLFGGFEYY